LQTAKDYHSKDSSITADTRRRQAPLELNQVVEYLVTEEEQGPPPPPKDCVQTFSLRPKPQELKRPTTAPGTTRKIFTKPSLSNLLRPLSRQGKGTNRSFSKVPVEQVVKAKGHEEHRSEGQCSDSVSVHVPLPPSDLSIESPEPDSPTLPELATSVEELSKPFERSYPRPLVIVKDTKEGYQCDDILEAISYTARLREVDDFTKKETPPFTDDYSHHLLQHDRHQTMLWNGGEPLLASNERRARRRFNKAFNKVTNIFARLNTPTSKPSKVMKEVEFAGPVKMES
jgi:hypothetical protein